MRASKFLSICVAMSRNQAKFFIRKGRLAVNGEVITDPYFELPDDCEVHFDGKPISITDYRYVVLHKPMAFVCATRSAEHASVFELIPDWPDDHYGYFANVLAPEQSGLVLLSDDAPWTNGMSRRAMLLADWPSAVGL
ncbi:MAG: S4 domain-containing protein [Pseudomonadota bacterium]